MKNRRAPPPLKSARKQTVSFPTDFSHKVDDGSIEAPAGLRWAGDAAVEDETAAMTQEEEAEDLLKIAPHSVAAMRMIESESVEALAGARESKENAGGSFTPRQALSEEWSRQGEQVCQGGGMGG